MRASPWGIRFEGAKGPSSPVPVQVKQRPKEAESREHLAPSSGLWWCLKFLPDYLQAGTT